MALATAIFRKRSARAYASVRERLGLVTATLAEDIAGMRIVQAFTREDAAFANFRNVAAEYRESNMQTVRISGVYFPAVDFFSSVALAVVLGYGGHLYFDGSLTIGTLFAFMLYVQNFFDPVQQLSQLYNTFLSATAALDKIMGVLDEQPEVDDRARRAAAARDHGPRPLRGRALPLRAGRRGLARHRPRRRRRGRRSRSSGTPAPASPRSPSCSPASTTRPRGA